MAKYIDPKDPLHHSGVIMTKKEWKHWEKILAKKPPLSRFYYAKWGSLIFPMYTREKGRLKRMWG